MPDESESSNRIRVHTRSGVLLVLTGLFLFVLPFIPAPLTRLGPIDAALIRPNGGYAYTVRSADLGLAGPLPSAGVELTEDGRPLHIDHMHSAIRSAGAGRYSPWGTTLYFAAIDNSDPRANGRAYVLTIRGSLLRRLTGDAFWLNYLAIATATAGAFLFCLGLPRLRPAWAARTGAGVMRCSAFDLRCVLRLALLYGAWRQASADYGAIPELVKGENLHALAPRSLDHLADMLQGMLLNTSGKLAVVQISSVTLLILAAVYLRRWTLWLALIPTLVIEWAAYHFRGQLPDIDPMLALLLMAACWPASWKAITQAGRVVTTPATALGLTLAAYIGSVYFICGWSKVITDGPWWKVVHLELLYAAMVVWMGSSPPTWLDGVARGSRDLFMRWPWLGEGSALLTMILELVWPLALLSRFVRWSVPIIMLAAHAVIFLTSGILFLPLALTGVSVVIPWRLFGRRESDSVAKDSSPLRAWMVWPVGVAAMLAVAPAMHSVDAFPFSNYQHFNWNHTTLYEPTLAYRLGYRDPATGEWRPIPPNYSGFMDCWGVTLAGREVGAFLNASSAAERNASLARLRQYARALRPHRSSRRLGWLSCPPHVLGHSESIPFESFDELHLLRGRFEAPAQSLDVVWEDCGVLPGWPESPVPTKPEP